MFSSFFFRHSILNGLLDGVSVSMDAKIYICRIVEKKNKNKSVETQIIIEKMTERLPPRRTKDTHKKQKKKENVYEIQ